MAVKQLGAAAAGPTDIMTRSDTQALVGSSTPLDLFRSLAIQVSRNRGSVVTFMRGIADDFRDQAGLALSEASQSLPPMTTNNAPTGYVITFSSMTNASEDGWKAFDGNIVGGGGAAWVANSGVPAWIERDNPDSWIMYAYNIVPRSDGYGSPTAWTLYGTNDGGTTLTILDTRTGQVLPNSVRTQFIIPPGNRASFKGYRITITATATGNPSLAELEFLKTSVTVDSVNTFYDGVNFLFTNVSSNTNYAMEARSSINVADVAPAQTSIFLLAKAVSGTMTLNTNVKAAASRDGGTTWTPFVLADMGVLNGYRILEANGLNISAQPLGTSVRYRVVTDASLGLAVDAVTFQWA